MSVARFKPQAEPATPPAGYIYFYCDIADDLLYLKFDTGTVVPVKPVGGGTGDLSSDGTVPLIANWDVGAFNIIALGFESDVATGTAPLVVASTTMVDNLNVEFLGGKDLATIESERAAAIASAVAGLYDHKGPYDASTNTPDLDTAPSGILKGDAYTVSVAGTFFAVVVEAGDVLIADQDNPVDAGDWTIVNRNIDSSAFATAAQGATADSAIQPGDDADLLGSGAATDGQVPTADGLGGIAWEDPTGGGGGGLTASVKTANYTITGSEDVGVNSTAGVFTITLKPSPSTGDVAFIHDVAFHCGTDAVAIARNGSTINGLAEDASLNTDGGGFWFIYNGTTWLFTPITSGGLSQAEVDARVVAVASGIEIERFYPEAGLQQTSAGNPAISWQTLGDFSCLSYDLPNSGFPGCSAKWKPPLNWNAGTLRARFWWTPSSTNTGATLFQINSTHASDGEVLPTKSFESSVFDAGAGSVDAIQVTNWSGAFTVGSAGVDDLIFLEFYRNAGDGGDTFTGTAYLLAVEVEYSTNNPVEG